MITASPKHRIFLAISPIDFRAGINTLAALCQHRFAQDPFTGHYFLFSNKRKNALKIFYYDSQGFCLFQKRLSSGRFLHWPTHPAQLVQLSCAQLQVLLFNGDPQTVTSTSPWRPVD